MTADAFDAVDLCVATSPDRSHLNVAYYDHVVLKVFGLTGINLNLAVTADVVNLHVDEAAILVDPCIVDATDIMDLVNLLMRC